MNIEERVKRDHEFLSTLKTNLVDQASLVNRFPLDAKRVISLYEDGLARQFQLGSYFHAQFENLKTKGFPVYSSEWLQNPWPGRERYAKLIELFLYQPSCHSLLLSELNGHFYEPYVNSWKLCREEYPSDVPSDYFNRHLGGTTKTGRAKAQEVYDVHLESMSEFRPTSLVRFFGVGYQAVSNSPSWVTHQGSLFPLGYRVGQKGYGRLRTIPGSTICNVKREVKASVLEVISKQTGLNFFEIDLKSCHLNIFRDLFDWGDRTDKYKLPDQTNVWSSMLAQLVELHQQSEGPSEVRQHVSTLIETGGKSLMGILKNQTYKSLNGGNPHACLDNITNAKNKLLLTESQIVPFSEYSKKLFQQIDVFGLLIDFIKQVSSSPCLYLPCRLDPFDTTTLSKKQVAGLFKNGHTPEKMVVGNTANSRLFSSLECCFILHLFATLGFNQSPILLIGYESDGILACSTSRVDEIKAQLETLNEAFSASIQSLTRGHQRLEIKTLFED